MSINTKLKCLMVLACLLIVSGCGTVNTVMRSDEVAAQKLTDNDTYCKSIPRVYSGVAYNFCSLYGVPAPYRTGNAGFYFIFFDSILSGTFDTVALPYTIFRQIDDGSITIHKPMY